MALNNTRCAIAPFTDSGNPITPETMSEILSVWAQLASAVEDAIQIEDDEVLVWALSLTGGDSGDITGEGSQPARAHAQLDICQAAHMPQGAVHISDNDGDQCLVTKGYTETNILGDGIVTKSRGRETVEGATKNIVRILNEARKKSSKMNA